MRSKIVAVLAIITFFVSCKDKEAEENKSKANLTDGLYAEIETNKGTITVQLDYKKTPLTVANFVSLAEGKNEYLPEGLKGKPFYDGLKFHRVISKTNGDNEDFMIQTGDPLGTGAGDTGYKFSDEITDLIHDKGGVLSMANSGPGTNSSQFFITIVPTPWLDGKHTVFGKVVEGGDDMKVVNSIIQGDVMKSVKIIRKGAEAQKFDAVKVFDELYKLDVEKQKVALAKVAEMKKPFVEMINNAKATGTKTKSGLIYKVTKKGNGKKPAAGTTVNLRYAGFFEDGTLFDSNIKSLEERLGKYNPQKDQGRGYEAMQFPVGTKEGLIAGFIEGIELLSYGEKAIFVVPPHLGYPNGYGDMIPPNTTIVFELEMLEK